MKMCDCTNTVRLCATAANSMHTGSCEWRNKYCLYSFVLRFYHHSNALWRFVLVFSLSLTSLLLFHDVIISIFRTTKLQCECNCWRKHKFAIKRKTIFRINFKRTHSLRGKRERIFLTSVNSLKKLIKTLNY